MAARHHAIHITVVNNTQYSLSPIRKNLEWGRWSAEPSLTIPPYGKNSFSSKGTAFGGIEGNIQYSIFHGSFEVYWSLSHWDTANHKLTVNDPYSLYDIYCVDYDKTTFTIYINERKLPQKYNALIMSDPQAWRLNSDANDPNKDRDDWESFNRKVSDSIKTLAGRKRFAFGIVNGDITEFGRATTRESFDKIYSLNLDTKLLLGLGNHDYANNVNQCTDPRNFNYSANACARNAFFDIINRMDEYKSFLDHYSSDYNKTSQKGSGAYSWDRGDIHYVQLHNYPTYNVVLDHYAAKTIYIEKSLDWLEEDLRNANARGKATVLNFHDAYDCFTSETTENERARLEKMVKDYNVIAIFSGHSHGVGESLFGFIRGVMHYDSGALYVGDYLVVAVDGKCIDVSRYNGSSGSPRFITKFNSVCGK